MNARITTATNAANGRGGVNLGDVINGLDELIGIIKIVEFFGAL